MLCSFWIQLTIRRYHKKPSPVFYCFRRKTCGERLLFYNRFLFWDLQILLRYKYCWKSINRGRGFTRSQIKSTRKIVLADARGLVYLNVFDFNGDDILVFICSTRARFTRRSRCSPLGVPAARPPGYGVRRSQHVPGEFGRICYCENV